MARVKVPECKSCSRKQGERHVALAPAPSIDTVVDWECDGAVEATDGCLVEPDGMCEHGHSSWMLVLNLI